MKQRSCRSVLLIDDCFADVAPISVPHDFPHLLRKKSCSRPGLEHDGS